VKPFLPAPRHTTPITTYKRHHYLNDIWIVRSPKMNRRMQLDSDLEYSNWVDTEGTPEVVALCEHPTVAEARINGVDHESLIDMYKQFVDASEEYVEVKYDDDLEKEETKLQIAVQVAHANRLNVKHSVTTSSFIASIEVKIRNWKRIIAILNLGRGLNVDKEKEAILALLLNKGPMPVAEIIQLMGFEDTIAELAICRLLQAGEIGANLSKEDFAYPTILSINNV
jgi:hypothetical protein